MRNRGRYWELQEEAENQKKGKRPIKNKEEIQAIFLKFMDLLIISTIIIIIIIIIIMGSYFIEK